MPINVISSAQNPRVEQLLLLQQKSQERRRTGLFVVEGRRELGHCLQGGYKVETLFYSPEVAAMGSTENRFSLEELLGKVPQHFEVSPQVYEKIAYRGTTEGVVGIVKAKENHLEELKLPENPLVVVLEGVEKPGNIGAVLRSADAAGVSAVVICNPLTDLYNPNLIRASMGAVFSVPIALCSTETCIDFLKGNGLRILTAQLQDSEPYYASSMKEATAIVMGTESSGLTEAWRQAADAHIRIPMLGNLDSLNVSVSASVLMFEALRQRLSKGE